MEMSKNNIKEDIGKLPMKNNNGRIQFSSNIVSIKTSPINFRIKSSFLYAKKSV